MIVGRAALGHGDLLAAQLGHRVQGRALGYQSAVVAGLPTAAATTAIFSPPAAAKIGGASPTAPMSTDPAPMAWSIGGPEVKSDQSP